MYIKVFMSQSCVFTAGKSVNISLFYSETFLQCMFKTLRMCMSFELVSQYN